jgi:transposase
MHAKGWWEGTYTKFLYPDVNLDSPTISKLLKEIGKDKDWRNFFEKYSKFIKKESPHNCAHIDSTGLPNAIKTDLSQICNHSGDVNREIRLIVVLDKNSGYPLYFKYIPGNIVDKVTLKHIFYEMDAYDIDITTTIMDAGYYSEENLKFLYDRKVVFLTHYIPNTKIYKRIIQNEINDIDDLKYHVRKDNRFLKVKCIQVDDIANMKLYAYICKNLVEANKSELHILGKFDSEKTDDKEIEEIHEKLRKRGIFILLSSIEMPRDKIIPFYYERQDIEQIFDFAKNDLDLLPLRMHSEATLRGHFMIVFMATIAHVYVRRFLEKSKKCKVSRSAAFEHLARQTTVVFDKKNFHLPALPSPGLKKYIISLILKYLVKCLSRKM